MPIETLTELQYSQERRGPFKLYVYEPDSPFRRGAVWFQNNPSDKFEITTGDALLLVEMALDHKREVRITDSGDLLVYHAKDGKVLYPNNPARFWEEVAA
jgi:hypothetical protein